MEKVLIATPTSSRHSYCIEEFLDRVRNLTHPNISLLLYDNTLDNGEYFEKLKEMTPEKWIKVKRYEWDTEVFEAVQMLGRIKSKMRKHFLLGRYTHYWDVASDMMLPENLTERLISHDRDIVGCVTHMYLSDKKQPAVIYFRGNVHDSGHTIIKKGLDFYSWKDVKKAKGLHLVWGCAAPLIKRKVLKKCDFRVHPNLLTGEDILFWQETNEKGFQWYCDMDINIEHKNISWKGVPTKRRNDVFMAVGPVIGEGFDVK